jgi:hypothetical protein
MVSLLWKSWAQLWVSPLGVVVWYKWLAQVSWPQLINSEVTQG